MADGRAGEEEEEEEEEEALKLGAVFRGVCAAELGALELEPTIDPAHSPAPGPTRRSAARCARRTAASHAFFYDRARAAAARGRAPSAPHLALAADADHARETELMAALGLPTALARGTAMTEDSDGAAYCVLSRAEPPRAGGWPQLTHGA